MICDVEHAKESQSSYVEINPEEMNGAGWDPYIRMEKLLEEEKDKVKNLEINVKETEEKVSTTLKGLEHRISVGFFRHYMEMGVPDKEDIKQLNTKIGVVLKELGFNHSCERCGEVFKTERQLKSHKKIHEEQDRKEDEAEEDRLNSLDK